MATPTTTIMNWCGITISAQRNRIMNKLLIDTEVTRHINDESPKGMITTFRDYSHRDVADGNIFFNRVQQKHMISLKNLVKQKVRLQEEAKFETGTTRAEFIQVVEEAFRKQRMLL